MKMNLSSNSTKSLWAWDKMLTKRKAIVGVKREKRGGVRLTCGTRFFVSRILLDWGDVIALRNDLDRIIKDAAGKETETE